MSTEAPWRVRKAVIPVAGRGLSLLPATRTVPKALLPIVDKPLVEFAVEEAAAAGIEQIIFVTPRYGAAIEDHFASWRKTGGTDIAFASVRQSEPRGVGHAVGCAETLVDGEPFALMLPDEVILDRHGGIALCIELYHRTGHSVVATEPITLERTASCGVLATERRGDRTHVTAAIERPGPERAPSLTGVVGRHVLTTTIFGALRETPTASGGEVHMTDALQQLIMREPVYAVDLPARRFDCGTRAGLVEAMLEFASRDPDLAPTVMRWRESVIERSAPALRGPTSTPQQYAPPSPARGFIVRNG